MPRVDPIQPSFNSGELSPLMGGRVDADRYKQGLAVCENYLPVLQGPVIRRPGSKYLIDVKNSARATCLVPFEFSNTQAYILEFGHNYIRFHKDHAVITLSPKTITGITLGANPVLAMTITSASHGFSNGDRVVISGVVGTTELNNREFEIANVTTNTFELKYFSVLAGAQISSTLSGYDYTAYVSGGSVAKVYEISSLYNEDELFDMRFAQSADVLYIAHPNHTPCSLSRFADTSWAGTNLPITDGPYLAENAGLTTLTPSAATGSGITLTANNVLDINNGEGFKSTDVGRAIRLKTGTTWGWALIATWVSTTEVTINIFTTLTNTTAKTVWRLSVWSATYGMPTCVVFHEDRLFWGGAGAAPQRLDGSRTSDYLNFSPSDADGTVSDSHAVAYPLNASKVNVIKWMTSDDKGLLVGTTGSEWVVKPSSVGEALTPTNVKASQATRYGSSGVAPVQVGTATLFVQRAGKKIREFAYFYDAEGFRASDLTLLSQHITKSGIKQMAYQKEDLSGVWCVRNDGVLAVLNYERETDVLKVGWSRQVIGGVKDPVGNGAAVESVACIPSPDGSVDEIWIIVKRYIDGQLRRTIEYFTPTFDENTDPKDAFFMDCGVSYDDAKVVTNFTTLSPSTVTAAGHGFSNGDEVLIEGVSGLWGAISGKWTISNVTTDTFDVPVSFDTEPGVIYPVNIPVDDESVTVRKYVSTVRSINHLNGETVTILADGAVVPDQVVDGGVITLDKPAVVIQIGLSCPAKGQIMRTDAGSATGTAVGKNRRTNRIGFLLFRTGGLKFGTDFDTMDEVTFRRSSDEDDEAVPLYSGVISEELGADYDMENQIAWRQDQPLPGTILAVMPQMVTQDR